MVLRSIAHDDPQIAEFKERISRYTKPVEPFGFAYQIYLEGDELVGIAFIGQEPMQLIRPIGTPLIRFQVIEYSHPTEVLNTFADEVLNLAKARDVEFAYLNIPVEQKKFAEHLEQIGFQELANRFDMNRQISESFEVSKKLRFEQIKREDVNRFFEFLKEFMSGSPDVVLNMVIENFTDVPEVLLDVWYESEKAYLVYYDGEVVGILDLVPQAGYIQNIGVAPAHRGKGFGEEMLRFCLNLFKAEGTTEADLGVHVDNKQAIRLYEKLGFSVKRQIQMFVWWKPS
ncbi:MAG: GNAT family N-acetyltransferase [Candidatus Hodarchaeota archaeon]